MNARLDRDDRVERLRAARRERSDEALAESQRAITTLQARGLPVTWEAVADAAGVSTSYLRKNATLSQRIRDLRPEAPAARLPTTQATSDSAVRNLRTKVQVMSERLRRQEDELDSLRSENAVLRGEVADLRRTTRNRQAREG